MTSSTPVTANAMREVLRKRTHKRQTAWIAILGSDIPPGVHTKLEMVGPLREKLETRGNRGVGNLIKNVLLEQRNPFEPGRRRLPKREVVGVGALLVILFAAMVWFNFLGGSGL
jgi:hypothetical protein